MKDELPEAGYLPGYRSQPSLSMSPFAPQVGGLPGGVTPSSFAPMPPSQWVFRWSGFLNLSGQFSTNERLQTSTGQSTTVFRSPPATIEDYASFNSTSAVPGHWVAMNFHYGNRDVEATITLTTWNPSEPTTYYQIGSQQFINNAYLDFRIPQPMEKLRLSSKIGYFYNNYGQLGQYNLGMYQNPIAAIVNGVGGTLTGEYDLSPKLVAVLEEGFMGNRNGKVPNGISSANPNYNVNPIYPSSYIQHLHAGLLRRGNTTVRAQFHYIFNWAQDDRPQLPATQQPNQIVRGVDESYMRDASMAVYTAELNVSHPAYGMLAVAATHLSANYAYTLRGVQTYGGEGQTLTDRWLGDDTGGTGTVNVIGFNYSGSLGPILAHPKPFDSNSPNLLINAGGMLANSHSGNPLYDGRVRTKAGIDLLYNFMAYAGAAIRVDRVAPSSKDSQETFHVVAPRLVFRTGWMSHENISLMYARWFYGAHSHMEASAVLPPRLDNQLFALNCNMWW